MSDALFFVVLGGVLTLVGGSLSLLRIARALERIAERK